jgi:hypothetical protein
VSCTECYNMFIELIESLGLVLNYGKVCAPTRVMTFLGVSIDYVARTLSLPQGKIVDLKLMKCEMMKSKKVTKLKLQRALGKLNRVARVVKGGRTFMRRFIDLTCKAWESFHIVRLTVEAKLDLSRWLECFGFFYGTCSFKCDFPLPSHCFATDACPVSGGCFCGADWFYVNWHLDCPIFAILMS